MARAHSHQTAGDEAKPRAPIVAAHRNANGITTECDTEYSTGRAPSHSGTKNSFSISSENSTAAAQVMVTAPTPRSNHRQAAACRTSPTALIRLRSLRGITPVTVSRSACSLRSVSLSLSSS